MDAGLRMERNSHAPFNPKIRGSVFTIQTQRRTYHLEADCESEMEQWVDAICRVCGLRSTQESPAKPVGEYLVCYRLEAYHHLFFWPITVVEDSEPHGVGRVYPRRDSGRPLKAKMF